METCDTPHSLFLHVFAIFFHAFVCVCARVSPKVKRDRLNQTCHDEMIRQVLLRRGQKDTVAIGRGYKKDVSGSVDIHRADETCLIVARRS